MTSMIEDLAGEQEHYDLAYDARERRRAALGEAHRSAAGGKAVVEVARGAQRMAEAMPSVEEDIFYGAIQFEDDEKYYIGKAGVSDKATRELLVVNWRMPVAEAFYKATPKDPHGLVGKRTFTIADHRVQTFVDTTYADLKQRIESLTERELHGIDDVILDDLAASRDGEMRDIVRTIHESQYDLLRHPLEELLVVQGGPGTGKTAVALHRVSWLLFNHSDQLVPSDVLVLGPNKTFGRYISKVLPGLGDDGVVHEDLLSLGPVSSNRRAESTDTSRLKGEARLNLLLQRGLEQRVRFPERREHLAMGTGSAAVRITREMVEEQLSRLRGAATYNAGRVGLRDWLTSMGQRRGSEKGLSPTVVDSVLDRIWPSLTPVSFLQDLLGSRQRLQQAAGDDFTAGDIERLYRPAAERLSQETWSDADIALLDEADRLINGQPTEYFHIVIDEAQDLTPMQIRSISKRSVSGSYTIVGDLAQATGPVKWTSWGEITSGLMLDAPAVTEHLEFGFRVPRQVTDLADRLLPEIAPGLVPPTVVRVGPEAPIIATVDPESVPDRVVEAATKYAGRGLMVGVICADEDLEGLTEAFADDGVKTGLASAGELSSGITLMTAEQSKGLEFEATVLAEPAAIAAAETVGLRLLYIALTRTTKFLTIVHSRQCMRIGLDAGQPEAVAAQADGTDGDVTAATAMSTPAAVGSGDEATTKSAVVSGRHQGDDLVTQIERLAALHERGLLTADEFKAAKAKLLAP